jgi:hypothetical protein
LKIVVSNGQKTIVGATVVRQLNFDPIKHTPSWKAQNPESGWFQHFNETGGELAANGGSTSTSHNCLEESRPKRPNEFVPIKRKTNRLGWSANHAQTWLQDHLNRQQRTSGLYRFFLLGGGLNEWANSSNHAQKSFRPCRSRPTWRDQSQGS